MKKSFKLWVLLVILGVFLVLGGLTAFATAPYQQVGSIVNNPAGGTEFSYAGANIIVMKQSTALFIWVDDSLSSDYVSDQDAKDAAAALLSDDKSWQDGVYVVRGDTSFNFNDLLPVSAQGPNYDVDVTINIANEKFSFSKKISHYILIHWDEEEFGSFKVSKVVSGDGAPAGTQFDILVAFASNSSLSGITYDGSSDDVEIEATATPGEYAVKLLSGEYAVFNNIPLNNTSYSVTEDDSSLSDYWTIPSDALTGSITGTTQVAVDVNNSYDGPDYGSLEVTKEVTGDETDGDESFKITVAFSLPITLDSVPTVSLDDILYESDVDADDLNLTENPDGTYTFYLKDGESIRFYDIPMGVTYEITEDLSDLQDGWTGPYNTDEHLVEGYTGTIDSTTEQDVTVTNNFDEPETGSLKVIKNVTDGDSNERFTITVTFIFPQITPMTASLADINYESDVVADDLEMVESPTGTFTFSLKDGEFVTFTNIPMGVTYTVAEDLTDEPNWEGEVVYPTESQVHMINDGILQTVNVNNDYDTPPEYGSLRVIKNVETGASTSEEFDIMVEFIGSRGDLADIEYNEEDTDITDGPDMDEVDEGVYSLTFYLSLADEEYVDFTNIPMGVSYTISEELTSDQVAEDWDGPNEDATGEIESTTRQTVTVYNEQGGGGGSDPKYGSLKVIKNVTGDGASETEEFAITVTFDGSTSQLNKIDFSGGNTESDGVYEFTLSDDEYVFFSNIPFGVSYTVSEELSAEQEDDGWTGPDADATGSIRSTAQKVVAIENTYEQGEVLGEKEEAGEDEDSGVLGVSEKVDPELPKTGGVSTTMYLLLIGFVLVGTGAFIGLKKKHHVQ